MPKRKRTPPRELKWKIPTRLDVLRDILSQYPDDGQILKEILQNAEDAGAKQVKFIYDKHEYPKEGLDPKLAKHQGPALYAYNDAIFTDDDFANLLNIQHSAKRDDRTKVGRFGRGFKSIFHMTEMPTLLSGACFGRVNPYNDAEPCAELSDVLEDTPEELTSFLGKFGFSEKIAKRGQFCGTIFRFPLRMEKSELSDTLYGEEKITDLLRMLEVDAHMNLLFLKSLVSVEVYIRGAREAKAEGTLQFSIELKDISLSLEDRLKFFKDLSVARCDNETDSEEEEEKGANNALIEAERRLTYRVELKKSGGKSRGQKDEMKQFIVCHYYNGKKESKIMKKLLEDPNFSYLPLVSVAMPIGTPEALEEHKTEGQLFCFLPLPLHDNTSPTGLPVHVNSFFVVSSNRSEIKWPTTGQQNVEKMAKDLQWNHCLVAELLPKAYMHLLQDATGYKEVRSHDICRAFPDLQRVNEKWSETLLPSFLKHAHLLKIFPTCAPGQKKYVCLKDAVLCPPSVDPDVRSTIIKLLVDAKKNPVCIPEYMIAALKEHCPEHHIVEATPQNLCIILKRVKTYKAYPREAKLNLLQYLLSEPEDTAADLEGIQLLPLADQTFADFNEDGEDVFIATQEERNLLPILQKRFVSGGLPPELMQNLREECVIDNTQLTLMTDDDVLELLPDLFPQTEEKVLKLKPNKEPALGHLTSQWCELVWHFFTRISEEDPDHLDKVRHLHLLPIVDTHSDFHLSKLSEGAVCIAASLHNEKLPDLVSKALPFLGVEVLHKLPNVIRHHPFVFDEGYIHQPNPCSVVQALVKLHKANRSIHETFNKKATSQQKKAFLQFFEPLASGSVVDDESDCKGFLKNLQLFETIDGSGQKPRRQASLAEVPNGVVSYTIPQKPRVELLDVSKPQALLMARFLGVRILTETSIIEHYILDDVEQRVLDDRTVEAVMTYTLHGFSTHVKNSKTFSAKLQNLSFLQDGEGHYRQASQLFDPRDDLLKELFSDEHKFPSTTYADHLGTLRQLGLKGREDVTAEELCHAAGLVHKDGQQLRVSEGAAEPKHKAKRFKKSIAKMHSSAVKEPDTEDKLKAKSRAIANIFLAIPSMLTSEKVKRRLSELAWIPVQTNKPNTHPKALLWNPKGKIFEKPLAIALKCHSDVISSSMAIIDTDFVTEKAVKAICGVCLPPCKKVIEHLRNISQRDSTGDKPAVMRMAQEVYRVLQDYDPTETMRELSALHLTDWVWQGDGFTSPACVTTSTQFNENLTPYAYILPRELEPFRKWLVKMGVKRECNPIDVLKRIKDWHDENVNVKSVRVKLDRRIAVNLLNEIVQTYPNGVPESIQNELVLPVECSDKDLSLLPASECTYHDKEWKLGEVIDVEQVAEEDEQTLHLLHRSISKATATALGVATMMNRLLEGDCEGFEFAAEFEGHGQEESLTHRLKHLLQDYPDGLAIPKELVQNADDAGASEIKFMFDERENEDAMTGLLDEGMRQCQGPALWIYNNATFSDEDLANIRKISGATKEEKKDKIGKFGLGFNAVYNVTDVPSFVTRDYVVFFDPHRTHLGKAMPRNDTGLKTDICSGSKRGAEMRKQLFNQFKPYHGVFGCQMVRVGNQKPYNGTLFRLPLRKPGTVSEIKNTAYTREDMAELIQLLLNRADELLLFTQKVKQIEVYHLPRHISDPNNAELIYTAGQQMVKVLKHLPVGVFPETNLLKVAQQITRDMPQRYPKGLHKAEIVVTKLDYNGGKAADHLKLQSQSRAANWILFGCFGLGKSFKLALTSASEVPVGGVAVKLERKRNKFHPIALDPAPVYCHLPLPSSIKSGLPVVLNGCFAIKPDRRHLVQLTSDDKENALNVWNKHLQEDAITEAYIGALELLTNEADTKDDPYCLWPSGDAIDEQFQSFYRTFYSSLTEGNGRWSPKIFTNGKIWVDFQHTVFIDEQLVGSDLKQVALNRLQQFLDSQENGHVAIDLPLKVRKELGNLATKTYSITNFYEKAVFPYIQTLAKEERDALLRFGLCCAEKDTELKKLFQNCCCIPVKPKGIKFLKPGDLVSPKGRCSSLFHEEDHVFPLAPFCGENHLRILASMGMRVDYLPWNCVIERAETVRHLKKDRVIQRTQKILSFIAWQHERTKDNSDLEQLRPIREVVFLPILRRPKDYPPMLPWKGDTCAQGSDLSPADDLYLQKHQNLIGSSCRLLDEERSGFRVPYSKLFLEQALGLYEKNPEADVVITQLQGVTKADGSLPSIHSACSEIYRYLNTCCQQANDASELVTAKLVGTKCLLVGDHFMYPEHCAAQFKIEFPPYISRFPYTTQRHLKEALKVKNSFGTDDVVEALHRVRVIGDVQKIVHKIRDIAEYLHRLLKQGRLSIEEEIKNCKKPVLLPSAPHKKAPRCQLLPVESLCLNLYPWLKKPCMDHNLCYVHPDITPLVAKELGVKTDGENIVELLGTGLGDPFGQKEKLTTRIRNILEGYPCDEGILKELLQNADDADATELRFVLDTGTRFGEKIFHKKWIDMQGPALCVYNNKPFSRDDLDGICNLGSGSKSSDTTKTGQYGIGFNCVYHLTDVPSFMTDVENLGRTLCFFDPNCQYVPGASVENPGRRFHGDKLDDIKEIFPDMCKGYHEEKFNNLDRATMFRLPLRSAKVAQSSEISKKEVTINQVKELMTSFKDELFYCLLFVNSVRSVTLEYGGKPYTVNASISDKDSTNLAKFKTYVKQIATQLKQKKLQVKDVKYSDVIYTLRISDSEGREETWSICQCIGFKTAMIPPAVQKAINDGEIALLPRGGVAVCKERTEMKGKPAGKGIYAGKGKTRIGVTTTNNRQRLFCFLPLPVDTQLPVHVNGHFALDSSRRALWDDVKDKTSGYKQAWNTMMMQEIVSYAYVSLVTQECQQLSKKDQVTGSELDSFYAMFPKFDSAQNSKFIQALCEAFYSIIKTIDLRFLAVQIPTASKKEPRWFSVPQCVQGHAVFDNFKKSLHIPDSTQSHTRSSYRVHHDQDTLGEILCSLGFNLLTREVPRFIYQALVQVNAHVPVVGAEEVLKFLYSYKTNTGSRIQHLPIGLTKSPFRNHDNILHVIQYICPREADMKSLQGLPLCLTMDGILREFQTAPDVYEPTFSTLLPKHPDKFLDASVFRILTEAVVNKAPRCVQNLTVEKLVPFLWKDYAHLVVEGRRNFDPQKSEKHLKSWLKLLWQLVDDEIGKHGAALQERLKPLNNFCIVPANVVEPSWTGVLNVERSYLYPLKAAAYTIDTSVSLSPKEQDVQKILTQAGIPSLDDSICGKNKVLRRCVSNIRDASGILKALSRLLDDKKCSRQLTSVISDPTNAREVRWYLSEALRGKCKTEEAEQFLSLPIHQITNGKVVSLQDSFVYLVPRGIPSAGLDNWYSPDTSKTEKFIFDSDDSVSQMYKRVGAIVKTTVDLYVELILLQHNFLYFFNDHDQQQHLKYIKDKVLPEIGVKDRKVLLAALEELPFLKDEDGGNHCAKDLYSPLEQLFQAMETLFPPRFFHSKSWIKFLGECGLHKDVTGSDLVRYARQVESEARDGGRDLEKKANLICGKLQVFADDKPTLFQVKDVKFLPLQVVPSDLLDLHPQYGHGEHDTFISFHGSAFYSQAEYCWTALKILPDWLKLYEESDDYYQIMAGILPTPRFRPKVVKLNQRILEALGVCCPLQEANMVAHCLKLSTSLMNNNPDRVPFRAEVLMRRLYELLSKMEEKTKLSDESIEQLEKAPVILVNNARIIIRHTQTTKPWGRTDRDTTEIVDYGKRLVCPDEVVITLQANDAIVPYLFPLPDEFFPCAEFFKRIGVKKEVSYKHYMNVLRVIWQSSKQNNVQGGVIDPNQLCFVSKATALFFKKADEDPAIQQETGGLYLLSRNNTLVLSSCIVRVDKVSWDNSERIKRIAWPADVVLLEEKGSLGEVYDKSLKILPPVMQPRLLSDIVEEDIDEGCTASVEAVGEADTQQYTKHIRAVEFQQGLERILRNDWSRDDDNGFFENWDKLEKNLSNISFHTVRKVQTVLRIRDGGGVLENSSEDYVGMFIKSLPQGIQVYIEKGRGDITKDHLFVDRFESLVVDVFPRVRSEVRRYIAWLFHWELSEITVKLDTFNVPILRRRNEPLEPSPGEPIPPPLVSILKQDIGTFEEGELVGCKMSDPLEDGNEGEEEFVIGRVIAQASGLGGNAFQTYEVDIGERKVFLFASSIYKFDWKKPLADEVEDDIEYDLERLQAKIREDVPFAYTHLKAKERGIWLVRLISRWQPENNPGHEDICKKVIKFIQARVDEEEAKGPVPVEVEGDSDEQRSAYNLQQVFEHTARRARENRKHIVQQRKWLETNSQMRTSLRNDNEYDYFRFMKVAGTSKGTRAVGSVSYYNRVYREYSSSSRFRTYRQLPRVPRPKPQEAKRWFRQAEGDLKASKKDAKPRDCDYDWALFKCYKAAELALKAAYFTKDSDNITSSNLVWLANRLHDLELSSLAGQITDITGGDATGLVYPADGATVIPRELYDQACYTKVYRLVEQLLERVKGSFPLVQ